MSRKPVPLRGFESGRDRQAGQLCAKSQSCFAFSLLDSIESDRVIDHLPTIYKQSFLIKSDQFFDWLTTFGVEAASS